MRIIAGEFRGWRLAAVKGRIRPTSDKVREAIFNILGPKVLGARVLDLYAGTGALTLEALSRGAAEAVLVEEHPAALSVLRQNLETLALHSRVRVLALPVSGAPCVSRTTGMTVISRACSSTKGMPSCCRTARTESGRKEKSRLAM